MKVALDIDGTILDCPAFFAFLTQALRVAGHQVLILTYRDPAKNEATRVQLADWGICFDDLVVAESLRAKGLLCVVHGVDIFFDDQDECIVDVPEHIVVFKIRNGGNFNFTSQRWLSTAALTKLLR